MRLAIILAFLAIAVVACAPVEQPIEPPAPEELPTLPDAQESNDDMESHETTQEHETMPEEEHDDPHAGMTGSATEMDSSAMSDDVDVVFEVTGVNFAFTVNGERNGDMVVNQGDRVRVEFMSTSGVHDWVVDQFGATEIVQTGGSSFVEFVADQAGTFEYYCSVGSHRQQGMRGNFIVQ